MALSDIEWEDVALVAAIVVTAVATIADEISGSVFLKGLKVLAPIVSLVLAIQRIRTGKPFYKDVITNDWSKKGAEFEVLVLRTEHGRGKCPSAKCLVRSEAGALAECNAVPEILPDGSVVVREPEPFAFRLEVRK